MDRMVTGRSLVTSGPDDVARTSRTIYFASGETMEELGSEEEEEEPVETHVHPVDPSTLTWGPFVWFHLWRMATSTVSVCDYMGERLASLFGVTAPKYQYAIDEFHRMKREQEEQQQEERLAEEAERQFSEAQRRRLEDAAAPQPDAFMNVGFELEPEMNTPDARVPLPLPS